jgi:hypothetical protein
MKRAASAADVQTLRLQARYAAAQREAENAELRHREETARLALAAETAKQRALWATVATLTLLMVAGGLAWARQALQAAPRPGRSGAARRTDRTAQSPCRACLRACPGAPGAAPGRAPGAGHHRSGSLQGWSTTAWATRVVTACCGPLPQRPPACCAGRTGWAAGAAKSGCWSCPAPPSMNCQPCSNACAQKFAAASRRAWPALTAARFRWVRRNWCTRIAEPGRADRRSRPPALPVAKQKVAIACAQADWPSGLAARSGLGWP